MRGAMPASRGRRRLYDLAVVLLVSLVALVDAGPLALPVHKYSTRIVHTKYGSLRGVILAQQPVEAFLGVPYASAPVGSLRYMPPVTPSKWRGTRLADAFSPVCPQRHPDISSRSEALLRFPRARIAFLERLLPLLANQSEDCLYMNIYVPHGGLSVDSSIVGPQSPLDMKPDTASLLGAGNFSPTSGGGGGGPHSPRSFSIGHNMMGSGSMGNQAKPSGTTSPFPPNHPLSGSKHLCSICGDRASGKHYGVYSCEGCKGFFKRTVRKDLTYACREDRNCIIDKRQRNRCQYCRYQKCLSMGMKREAVQEERQRTKERDQSEVESTSNLHTDMPVERILEAELRVECKMENHGDMDSGMSNICQATNKQLYQLVEWAKHIPHFASLPLEDQVLLLRAGWNELLIAAFSHRSIEVRDGIVLATGLTVHRNSAHQAGVGNIFDRVLTELVSKMRDMRMDKSELGCLRTIILFNPDVRGLKSQQEVEILREKVYTALDEYTRTTHPDEPGRFAKLLLRLPSLRSIGLKCLEHLFFFRLIGDVPIDTFLTEMLESHSDP